MNEQSAQQWQTGTIGLNVNGARLEMQLTIPAENTNPRRMLPVFRHIAHAFVDLAIEQEPAAISCKAGCGACCRQLVPISQLEAGQIAELVGEMPTEKQSEIRRKFDAAIETLEAAGLLALLRRPDDFAEETPRSIGLKYLQANVACPFLENESCSIHSERPLACREYLVTSPPENCANPSLETVARVPLAAQVSNAVVRLSKQKPGSRYIPYVPLVLALEHAAETPDELPPDDPQKILKQIFTNIAQHVNS